MPNFQFIHRKPAQSSFHGMTSISHLAGGGHLWDWATNENINNSWKYFEKYNNCSNESTSLWHSETVVGNEIEWSNVVECITAGDVITVKETDTDWGGKLWSGEEEAGWGEWGQVTAWHHCLLSSISYQTYQTYQSIRYHRLTLLIHNKTLLTCWCPYRVSQNNCAIAVLLCRSSVGTPCTSFCIVFYS